MIAQKAINLNAAVTSAGERIEKGKTLLLLLNQILLSVTQFPA